MSAVSRNGRCFSGEKQQDEVIKMGKYFGTDGFRGEANENLTADQKKAIHNLIEAIEKE